MCKFSRWNSSRTIDIFHYLFYNQRSLLSRVLSKSEPSRDLAVITRRPMLVRTVSRMKIDKTSTYNSGLTKRGRITYRFSRGIRKGTRWRYVTPVQITFVHSRGNLTARSCSLPWYSVSPQTWRDVNFNDTSELDSSRKLPLWISAYTPVIRVSSRRSPFRG